MDNRDNNKERDDVIFRMELCEEELQEYAISNRGRKLTDVELNRMHEGWMEVEAIASARYNIICALVEDALDTKDDIWSGIDEDYIASKKSDAKS